MKIFVISADGLPASVEASLSIIVIVEASRSLNDDDESDDGSDGRNHTPIENLRCKCNLREMKV